ncbi:hypothetical protein ACH4E9_36565 [Streptomyces anulatus]
MFNGLEPTGKHAKAASETAGDAIQRSVDWGLSDGLNEDNSKVDSETRDKRIKHYEDGQGQLNGMMRGVAIKRGLTEDELDASPGEFENHLQEKAKEWYLTGLAEAKKLTGE